MNNKFKKILISIVASAMCATGSMGALSASAADVPDTNGDLYYNCGQTSDVVYSEIGRKTYVTKNYQVKASVKVGGNTYTTGYKRNYAYIEHERHWWTNETAWYEWYAE